MKHENVIELYLEWTEGRVDETTRLAVQEHLEHCHDCRKYYEKMSLLLEKPDASLLPRLEPDPYLLTRIRALAEKEYAPTASGRARRWIRYSFASIMLLIAATTGIFLGSGLSTTSTASEEKELIDSYYEAFSQSGFEEEWDSIIDGNEEEI